MADHALSIDNIDLKIIELIQDKPNLTHSEIAERVNRSQPTIGMRIRRLESSGILKFQAGINIKYSDLYIAQVSLQAKNVVEMLERIKKCPLMLNAFKSCGSQNISLIIAGFELKDLEKLVNYHFRKNPNVSNLSMNVITEFVKDFLVNIHFNFTNCNCELKDRCLDKFKDILL